MPRIGIDVRLKAKETSKPAEEEKASTWPCMPFEGQDDQPSVLQVVFWDGSSEPDEQEESGFKTLDAYGDNETVTYNETHESVPWDKPAFTNTCKQNAAPTALQIVDIWGSQSVGSLMNRMPIRRTEKTDIDDNNGIWPTATISPNIECVILDGDGIELSSADYYAIEDVETNATYIEDHDEGKGLGYQWFGIPDAAHIRVTEKCSTANYVFADGFFLDSFLFWIKLSWAPGDPWQVTLCTEPGGGERNWDPSQANPPGSMPYIISGANSVRAYPDGGYSQLKWEIEGIFWHTFDTSDTDTFKITKEPSYDGEEQTEALFNMDTNFKTLNVFLMPRLWWSFFRFSSGNDDVDYGILTVPPKDWAMPSPREVGQWETNHPFDQHIYAFEYDISDYETTIRSSFPHDPADGFTCMDGVPPVALDDSNCRLVAQLNGDSKKKNGFYLFHRAPIGDGIESLAPYGSRGGGSQNEPSYLYIPPLDPTIYPWYRYGLFGTECPDLITTIPYDYMVMPFGSWRKCPELGDALRKIGYFYTVLYNSAPRMVHALSFWGSAPDGKIPTMKGRMILNPGMNGYYDADLSALNEAHCRLHFPPFRGLPIIFQSSLISLIYDESAYDDDQTQIMTDLMDHFLSRKVCDREGQSPSSWMLGVAGAADRELVGVIEDNGRFLYVWRREKENLEYAGPHIGEGMDQDRDLFIGSFNWDIVNYDYNLHMVTCPDILNILPRYVPGYWAQFVTSYHGRIELEENHETDHYLIPKIRYWGAWTEFPSRHDVIYNVDHSDYVHRQVIDLGRFVRPMIYRLFDGGLLRQTMPDELRLT